jgi:hypothetical protein
MIYYVYETKDTIFQTSGSCVTLNIGGMVKDGIKGVFITSKKSEMMKKIKSLPGKELAYGHII